MRKRMAYQLCIAVCLFIGKYSYGQNPTYPESAVDQSFIPPSPNAQAFETYGNDPVTLFEGVPVISIPIYTVKCGSLTLPISLTYNYNGLLPLQDAGWVGLGWNLNAGGVVSRTVEGGVDGIENSGYNYNQYNLIDTLFNSTTLDSFLQKAYNPKLAYGKSSYDMAPDIYDAEFNGYSGKFFWCNNKAYLLSYTKQLGISLSSPTGVFTITTDNGTQYIFSSTETDTSYYYGGADSIKQSYISAWMLNTIISADKKDTIQLSYTTNTWKQAQVSYQTSYTLSTGAQGDWGYDPCAFPIAPSIQSQTLQSIRCRNSRIVFVPDGTSRTDVIGNYPRLKEIDVIDSVTGSTVKKNIFFYEYFGQRVVNPTLFERLALKSFSSVNPQLSTDTLTYTFKYIHETDSLFPAKNTYGSDYWGFANGSASNGTYLPPPTSIFYSPAPPSGAQFGAGVNRAPSFNNSSYGALDTIVYPAGGFTAFQYQQNNFYNSSLGGLNAGPGICLQSTTTVSNNPTSQQTIQKNYTYLLDDGVTNSGILTTVPNFTGPPFVLVNTGTRYNYNIYKAQNNTNGIGGINPMFYYKKVTETMSSGGEIHKTDHYFTSFSDLFLDVRETQRVDFLNALNSSYFSPITNMVTNYVKGGDTSFTAAWTYIDTEYVDASHNPKNWYSYNYNYTYWTTHWVHPTSQQTTQYDANGNTISNTVNYFFDPGTRNLTYTESGTSDGQTLVEKFKYPEDYSASLMGNMVNSRILFPTIERQTWLKQDASDSVLISGNITTYDQTIFKPINTYSVELTSPLKTLSNETTSGGKFTSILSDARYVLKGQIQYDGNNNLSTANKASDINISYLWDYKHSSPIAEVKNASQTDIAYSSFESDGKGNWSFSGAPTTGTSATGNSYYNLSNGSITKSGLTSSTSYIVSYWTTNASSLTIAGTVAGYPIKGKTIGSWTYYEHKISGQTSATVSGTGNIDELRLYPATAVMTTYTYNPLIGISSQCDADNRITYYQYDSFGRLKVVLDQDHNVVKTVQYHTIGESNE
jgi:YD repeat-containing protein